MPRETARFAAEELYRQYRNEVYRYALFVLGNPIDVEDVTQETFLRVYRHWSSFREKSQPKTWLWSILRNCLADAIRQRKKDHETLALKVNLGSISSIPMYTITEWEDILRSLSLPQRQVIYWRLIEDMSVKDTAELLGWGPVKVRVTLHRAVKRLKEVFHGDLSLQQGGKVNAEH
jgi:RNA polymerase sigma-70 factor, ECF subfamily